MPYVIFSRACSMYHAVRKCRDRLWIHVNTRTIFTSPDRVELLRSSGFDRYWYTTLDGNIKTFEILIWIPNGLYIYVQSVGYRGRNRVRYDTDKQQNESIRYRYLICRSFRSVYGDARGWTKHVRYEISKLRDFDKSELSIRYPTLQ